jgi:hypothetical protein
MRREVTFVVLLSGVSGFEEKLGRMEFGDYFRDDSIGNHIGLMSRG